MTLKWLSLLTLAALILVGFWGCSRSSSLADNPTPAPTYTPETPVVNPNSPIDPMLVAAQNRFGFELLSTLQQQSPAENRVVSPLSVAMILSMAQNGAAGSTLEGMRMTLSLEGLEVASVNDAIASQIAALEGADPDSQLAIANSLWARSGGLELQPDFVQIAKEAYGAEAQVLDFDQPSALETINGWVNRATAGKIPDILDRIERDDLLFLINAVYFKGLWQVPFDPAQTATEPFYLTDGTTATRPLMSRSGEFRYSETDTFQAVNLPYGNGRLSMVVVLPKTPEALQVLQGQLSAETWQQWTSRFRSRPGSLKLPRFQMEYGTDLNGALSTLGMGVAFDPEQADFSNLSDTELYISRVKHKTFIEVNEVGTEAAGVTSIEMRATAAPMEPLQPFEMVVNRPFFLAIQDQVSGSILFLGWIMDPTP